MGVCDLTEDKVNDFVLLHIENVVDLRREEFENNLMQLPPLYNFYAEPFIHNGYLYSIYEESYFCIVYGQYHAGIVLMGQLLELTLFEIIRIHTGESYNGSFAKALRFAAGKLPESPNPPIVHPDIIKSITNYKNAIRNPYTHGDLRGIFRSQTAPAIMFKVGTKPEEILQNIEKAKNAFEEGQIPYSELNPADHPSIAPYFKRYLDTKRAFLLAWKIYPLFDLLLDLYLGKSSGSVTKVL